MTAFLALLRRDVTVAVRTAGFYLVSALTQPVLVVLVFGNILPRIGLVAEQFKTVMLPGLMSITMLMAGVQGVLMPLMTDLAGTREVDERLLAPIGVRLVAVERRLGPAAAQLAASAGLRGADAVYAALAQHLSIPLITWDEEIQQRASALLTVIQPPHEPAP